MQDNDHHGRADDVTVELSPLGDEVAERLKGALQAATELEVFMLPTRVDLGAAHYRETIVTAPKELRAVGVPIEFLYGVDERRVLSEFSAEGALGFAIGVSQNMTWDVAKQVVFYLMQRAQGLGRRGTTPHVELEVARLERDGLTIENFRYRGPATSATAERMIEFLTGEEGGDKGAKG